MLTKTAKLAIGSKDGQIYYDHALTEIEKSNLIDQIDLVNSQVYGDKAAISDIKDKRLISILQTDASKVLDENGEPMPVYHGTDFGMFTVFDTDGHGKDSYAGYAAWSKNILSGDEEKLKAWIASLPDNDKRGVSKSTLSKLAERLHKVLSDDATIHCLFSCQETVVIGT